MNISLALRNIFRNKRRTILNLSMMAGAFAAVTTFSGFSANILESTRWGAVNGQYGHIQIANKKIWDRNGSDSFRDRQLETANVLQEKISKIPGVKSVSPRQSFYGLVSNGQTSVAAQVIGYEPQIENEILEPTTLREGHLFTPIQGPDGIYQAAVGEGLAAQLSLKPGDQITILAQTADGAMNAVDTNVIMTFRTVIQEIDDSTIYVPIELSRKILDTDTAERLIVKLRSHELVDEVYPKILPLLDESARARTWLELARLYTQTAQYFESQNMVVASIIFFMIFLSTVSAVSMSVTERTGEIGTLRAIGRSSKNILSLFAFEGLFLGVFGSIIGVGLALLAAAVLNRLKLPIVLPGASTPIPILITFVLSAYIKAFLAIVGASFIATLLAARRATKMKIIDCLKYNI
ncbi:ABC transporter permease [soil metagenome]